jgi:hypothetical protein
MFDIHAGEVAAYARRWNRFNILLLDLPVTYPEHTQRYSKSIAVNYWYYIIVM